MCIAVPGVIIERDGNRGRADVRGNLLNVELGLVNADVGDCVLIHAGCAIALIDRAQADELNDLLAVVSSYEQ